MDILGTLFWVIVIIVWIVSALVKKQAGTPRGKTSGEGEGYRKPGEALERFLRQLSGEEEIKAVPPPFEPLVERVTPLPEPQPRVERVVSPKAEEPVYQVKPLETGEDRLPLLSNLNISAVRQGIILSEILGPPRAEKPFL